MDESAGFSCCLRCGRVVEDIAFATDMQFTKGADGEGALVGQFVGEGGQPRGMARYSGGRMWAGQVRRCWAPAAKAAARAWLGRRRLFSTLQLGAAATAGRARRHPPSCGALLPQQQQWC